MQLNRNKCGVLFYNPSKHYKLKKFETTMQNIDDIPIVETYTYLGVILTKNLNMKQQIVKMEQKI
jgi:hypothetical protein